MDKDHDTQLTIEVEFYVVSPVEITTGNVNNLDVAFQQFVSGIIPNVKNIKEQSSHGRKRLLHRGQHPPRRRNQVVVSKERKCPPSVMVLPYCRFMQGVFDVHVTNDEDFAVILERYTDMVQGGVDDGSFEATFLELNPSSQLMILVPNELPSRVLSEISDNNNNNNHNNNNNSYIIESSIGTFPPSTASEVLGKSERLNDSWVGAIVAIVLVYVVAALFAISVLLPRKKTVQQKVGNQNKEGCTSSACIQEDSTIQGLDSHEDSPGKNRN